MYKRKYTYFFMVNLAIMFIYSIIYFLYFNFSLKQNPEDLNNTQRIFNFIYWISNFVFIITTFSYYFISAFFIRVKLKKYRKKKNVTIEKSDELILKDSIISIFFFLLYLIFTSWISLLNLLYYNSVFFKIENDWKILFVSPKFIKDFLTFSPVFLPLLFVVYFYALSGIDDLDKNDISKSENIELKTVNYKKRKKSVKYFSYFSSFLFAIIAIFSIIFIALFYNFSTNSNELSDFQLNISLIYWIIVVLIYIFFMIFYLFVFINGNIKWRKKDHFNAYKDYETPEEDKKLIKKSYRFFWWTFLLITIFSWIFVKTNFNSFASSQTKLDILNFFSYVLIFALPIAIIASPLTFDQSFRQH